MRIEKLLLALSLLFVIVGVYSQEENPKPYSTTLLGGLSSPLLSGGYGWYLSVNPVYKLHKYFALEGQLSYNYNKITSSFLSGRTGFSHTISTLAGSRLYLTKQDRKLIPYVNVLIGGMYNNEQKQGLDLSPYIDFGASAGAFLLINNMVLGVSFEGSGLIAKFGCSF